MSKSSETLDIAKKEESFANAPTSKKIGFFSAMLVVIGSSVGAGIFFKAGAVLNNSQNSIVFAMFSWILAGFAVISMALALIEIASARNDNLSLIGWCQTFNSRFVYKACKNFMVYIYLPLTYFFMPLYVVLSIQDGVNALLPADAPKGFGTNADWAILMIIALLISVYFIVVNGISAKAGNIHNWIITAFKFLPLVFAAIIGFVILGVNGKVAGPDYKPDFNPTPPSDEAGLFSLSYLTPGFGLFIAMGAIFFAFDGFYVTAGIQTEMKEPKKTPLAILMGMIVVTVIYLIIAISMSLGSTNGGPSGIEGFLKERNLEWLYATFQILIGIGVLGIINGFALWSTRFIEDLIKANEVPYSTKYVNKINDKKAWVGIAYNLVLAIPTVVVFCIIGGLAYVNAYGDAYGTGSGNLYTFADLMATWTSVLAFTFILFAIVGAIKNRKTNKVDVVKSKYFLAMGWSSVLTMILPIFFTFFEPIANMFMLFHIDPTKYGDAYTSDVLVPRIMSVVALLIFISLMIVPMFIEDYQLKKKYGSIEKGEIHKIELMANATGKTLKDALLEQIKNEKRKILNVEEQAILGMEKIE